MDVVCNHNQYNFTSLNNPVKPFKVATKAGNLYISEVSVTQLKNKKVFKPIARLFCKSFSQSSKEPYWLSYNEKGNRNKLITNFVEYFQPHLSHDDGNLTMLVAKNKKGKICGACLSYTYKEVPFAENTTCYVDSLAVDKSCRGTGLGKILLEKTLDINKDTYTDVFIKAINKAVGFYEKLGFEKMNPKVQNQNKVIEQIAKFGEGYPDYATLMTKPIQANKPRWFDVVCSHVSK